MVTPSGFHSKQVIIAQTCLQILGHSSSCLVKQQISTVLLLRYNPVFSHKHACTEIELSRSNRVLQDWFKNFFVCTVVYKLLLLLLLSALGWSYSLANKWNASKVVFLCSFRRQRFVLVQSQYRHLCVCAYVLMFFSLSLPHFSPLVLGGQYIYSLTAYTCIWLSFCLYRVYIEF